MSARGRKPTAFGSTRGELAEMRSRLRPGPNRSTADFMKSRRGTHSGASFRPRPTTAPRLLTLFPAMVAAANRWAADLPANGCERAKIFCLVRHHPPSAGRHWLHEPSGGASEVVREHCCDIRRRLIRSVAPGRQLR